MRLLLLLLMLPAALRAEETAAFLKLGSGARAVAMGGAFTAVADDVGAVSWNPAGLAALSKRELGVTHAELPAETRYDFIGFAQPTRHGAFGASGAYLSYGTLEGRSATGAPTGDFKAADSAAAVSYAARLPAASVGGTVKFVRTAIGQTSAQTFAVDLGARRNLGTRGPGALSLGAAVQNMGPGLRLGDRSSQLPLTLAGGIGYRLPLGILMSADVRHRPHSRQNEVAIGTEYALLGSFAVRGGYGASRASSSGASGALNGFAGGFGLTFFGHSLDYSMSPFGELGNVQRFSLAARF